MDIFLMLDDVWRIEINEPYERKIEVLYHLKNQTHREWTKKGTQDHEKREEGNE